MTDKLRAAMQQALEALGRIHFAATELDRRNRVRWFDDAVNESKQAITALREALAEQAEQEPMYISESCAERGCACHYSVEVDGEPVAVYSAPVRTKDLTDDEIEAIHGCLMAGWVRRFARAVIAADREKNK